MSILETVGGLLTDRREKTYHTYRTLLARADNPEPKDAKALADAMTELGLTTDDAASDLQAMRTLAELYAANPSDEDTAAAEDAAQARAEQRTAARAACRERRLKAAETIRQAMLEEAEHAQAEAVDLAAGEAELQRRAANREALESLKAVHPRIFE